MAKCLYVWLAEHPVVDMVNVDFTMAYQRQHSGFWLVTRSSFFTPRRWVTRRAGVIPVTDCCFLLALQTCGKCRKPWDSCTAACVSSDRGNRRVTVTVPFYSSCHSLSFANRCCRADLKSHFTLTGVFSFIKATVLAQVKHPEWFSDPGLSPKTEFGLTEKASSCRPWSIVSFLFIH